MHDPTKLHDPTKQHDWTRLPDDLPAPEDDGACDHLVGMRMPALALPSTTGGLVDLSDLPGPRTVIYAYPRTGRPGEALPTGWDAIPGARGCTPQTCAFRDHQGELRAEGAAVFGLSTQDTDYQREMAERLHLPFAILSDADLAFTHALRLPTFEVDGMTLIKRLTLIVRDGAIEHVLYPVFPPDRSALDVLAWLQAHRL
jgi:peroxiredoxin